MTCIQSLWNIWRTIWFGHFNNICTGHQVSLDMCSKNQMQASWHALNCFVTNSTHCTIVGWTNKREKTLNEFLFNAAGTQQHEQEEVCLPSLWHGWKSRWRTTLPIGLLSAWRPVVLVISFAVCNRISATWNCKKRQFQWRHSTSSSWVGHTEGLTWNKCARRCSSLVWNACCPPISNRLVLYSIRMWS